MFWYVMALWLAGILVAPAVALGAALIEQYRYRRGDYYSFRG